MIYDLFMYNMGKTGDLFKKIRDTKGIFHAKMGTIKDRNGMDVTEAEDIKKRSTTVTIFRWHDMICRNLKDPTKKC